MARLTFVPASYAEAEKFLGDKSSRRVGNNTWVERDSDGGMYMRLHDTRVVRYAEGDELILDSGGWKTPTTKDRLNQVLHSRGLAIFQDKSQWYIAKCGDWNHDHWLPFVDGTVIDNSNAIKHAGSMDDVKATQKLVRRINKYAKACAAAVGTEDLPLPGPGDCIYCAWWTVNGKEPLGEAMSSTDHLLSHLDEMYLVPSLVYRAMQLYTTPFMLDCLYRAMDGEDQGNWLSVVQRNAQAAVVKYLKLQLGVAR